MELLEVRVPKNTVLCMLDISRVQPKIPQAFYEPELLSCMFYPHEAVPAQLLELNGQMLSRNLT